MCGIAGFVSPSRVFGVRHLQKVSHTLRHRGPDDEGYVFWDPSLGSVEAWSGEFARLPFSPEARPLNQIEENGYRVGLLHRRLAIIAPEAEGHQPMANADHSLFLDFNGEIYNYKLLRTELENLGCIFSTRTDTEVVLQAYQTWGISFLDRLDGMWAMAILDLKQRILFASTDRTGIKPFYYHAGKGGFCFASEIKAFRDFELPFTPNPGPISRFLAFGESDYCEETMFQDIHRLPAGHLLKVDLGTGQVEKKSWHQWAINLDFESGSKSLISESQRVETIQSLLREMIKLRLQADVPLGVCLSGGVDSSTIAGLVADIDQREGRSGIRKSFMAVLPPGSHQDESAFARQMSTHAGFSFHTTQPSANDFLQSIEDLMYTLDEPPPGLNAFSQYAVFRLVAENGVRVTLDGQGADEIFAGYPRHHQSRIIETLVHGSIPSGILETGPATLWSLIRDRIPKGAAHTLLLARKPEYKIFRPEVFAASGVKGTVYNSVNKALEMEYSSSSLPFLVKAADRNSMRWSVESRMPFADYHPLGEAMFSIPGSAKIRNGQTKYLLRKAAAPFVPENILNRRDKVGFAAPNAQWLGKILESSWARELPLMPDFMDENQFEMQGRRFIKEPGSIDPLVLWRALALRIWGSIFSRNQH